MSAVFPALPILHPLSLQCRELVFKHCTYSLGYTNIVTLLIWFEHNGKHLTSPLGRTYLPTPRPHPPKDT